MTGTVTVVGDNVVGPLPTGVVYSQFAGGAAPGTYALPEGWGAQGGFWKETPAPVYQAPNYQVPALAPAYEVPQLTPLQPPSQGIGLGWILLGGAAVALAFLRRSS